MVFTTGHALVIGVGVYQHTPRLNVALTATDATQVAAVLQDENTCGYPKGQVALLTGAAATRDGILGELERLATATNTGDTVVFFYSGHGEYGADGYYLTTHETRMQDGKVVDGSGVRAAELLDRLRKIPAKRALLLFNACHAGEMSPGSLSGVGAGGEQITGQALPDDLTAALLGAGEGRVVITACREAQKSYFGWHDPTTLFGQALIDGLRGQSISPRRGYISVFDLYDHLYSTVRATVRSRWGLDQEPELTVQKGVGVMAVALYRGEAPSGALGDGDRPADLQSLGQVREVARANAEQKLEQILSGALNLAAGRDMISGGQYNVQAAPGAVIGAQGPVEVRNVTVGGDYAEGDIDKRKGIFGGSFYGEAIGNVEGNVTLRGGRADTREVALEQVQSELRQAISAAEARADEELASDLRRIAQDVDSAIAARSQGDDSRLQARLNRARRDMQELAGQRNELRELSNQLARAR